MCFCFEYPKTTDFETTPVTCGINFKEDCLFCLFVFVLPSFEENWVSLIGFSLTSVAGIDDNAPYQELQIKTLANPGI